MNNSNVCIIYIRFNWKERDPNNFGNYNSIVTIKQLYIYENDATR